MLKTRFMIMLVIFGLGAILFSGFAFGQEGAESAEVNTITASGVLKAVDLNAGTVTITIANGEELFLTLKEESKIQVGGSLVDITQLAAKIDSQVEVEYKVNDQIVTVITVE